MVELDCGRKTLKYMLFVINCIFFALGAVAFGLGIWALVDKNKMNVLTKIGAASSNFNINGLLESAAIVLLVGGLCVMIIGFLGCCGAIMQKKCLLCSYAIFLLLIVVLEIAAIVIAASFRGKVTTEMKSFLRQTINSKYQGRVDTKEPFSLALDYAQVYFQCCGIDSYADFNGASAWKKTGEKGTMKIPPACCKLKDKDALLKHQKYEPIDWNCPYNPTAINSNMNKPCWASIEDYLKSRIGVVIGIAAGILVSEILCVVFAFCIIRAMRGGYSDMTGKV
ncbi:tetraspanin-18-like isoform X1 [Dreissena polymorpha]|uniref:tetraspanin-18-like isoform X1 n=1 Tax=Dreissena polymorpha TaxID=45954 RepID=UPI0022651A48|nr:tetraspanin-18-like isoform X1 [Dreissena polymorpha]